jgi:hypothetical protein
MNSCYFKPCYVATLFKKFFSQCHTMGASDNLILRCLIFLGYVGKICFKS